VSSLLSRLAEAVRAGPDTTALLADGETCSYGDLDRRARRFAGWLRAAGVAPGDRVAAMLPNGIAWTVCYYGTLLAGAVAVPLNHRASTERTLACVTDCTASLLVCPSAEVASAAAAAGTRVVDASAGGFSALLREAPGPSDPAMPSEADLAAVLYGVAADEPRGVELSHGNLAAAADAAAQALGMGAGQGLLCGFPQFLAVGQTWGTLAALGSGACVVTAEQLTPRAIVTLVADHRVRIAGVLPGMLRSLLGEPGRAEAAAALATVLCCGGAALDARTARKAASALDCSIVEGYGRQESAGVATLTDPAGPHVDEPGSLGRAVPGAKLRVTDERHREVPAGELGHVQLAGPMISPGYWTRPEETAQSRPGGWLDTGEVGWLDAAGHLFLAEGPGWTQLMPGQGLGRSLRRLFERHGR
jgi:long-chain acyl-CoA synthetase